ncbi:MULTISPECIES: uracil-DNA glycosylase [unclassified Sphingomonas]|uniref:uracil-DNA glycosylase n=1 Tax=unclassified Sphingomonas TaxID=196159 RepID=UPI002AB5D93C|nr:uracil-DNA glycosylase [Sphingomonas sp. 10B4]MDY7524208.1 uracil-DNA glycosylase [Sphingomonas sp. 10B4]MEB0281960.1 uracil-DNA glycosylase [Sphingomonas sp. 10B4]
MNFAPSPLPETEPSRDCPLCPRLVGLRETLRVEHPAWWNAPVPAFGDPQAWLGIVGLAPGQFGANRTGRPFTGDRSGPLLFDTLAKFGLATGDYEGKPDDTLQLDGVMIVNAVKCLPPENKPTPEEIRTCRPFLEAQADAVPSARVFIALGQVAHQSAVKILGGRLPKCRFAHGAEHRMPDGRVLIDSYHCSSYNQSTGRLTAEMFEAIFARALELRAQG